MFFFSPANKRKKILESFFTAAQKLRALGDDLEKAATDMNSEVERLKAKTAEYDFEAECCHRIAQKIEGLLG